MNYEAYVKSDEGGKQFIMRTLFTEHKAMKDTIERLVRQVERLERRQSPVTKLQESFKAMSKDGVIAQYERAQKNLSDPR